MCWSKLGCGTINTQYSDPSFWLSPFATHKSFTFALYSEAPMSRPRAAKNSCSLNKWTLTLAFVVPTLWALIAKLNFQTTSLLLALTPLWLSTWSVLIWQLQSSCEVHHTFWHVFFFRIGEGVMNWSIGQCHVKQAKNNFYIVLLEPVPHT